MPDSIAAVGAFQPTNLHGSVDNAMSALGGMDSKGFLNLLVAQLRYQDPSAPADPGDLMTQTAALAQLDATQQLLAAQQQAIGMQQAVAAAGMLGTTATAFAADGTTLTGVVDAVRYTPYGPVLLINGIDVPFDAIGEVRTTAGAATATTPTDPTATTAPPAAPVDPDEA